MGHEAYNGEDDEACKHAGAGVDAAHYDGVPEEKRNKMNSCDEGVTKHQLSVRMYKACSYLYTSLWYVL